MYAVTIYLTDKRDIKYQSISQFIPITIKTVSLIILTGVHQYVVNANLSQNVTAIMVKSWSLKK